MAQDQPLSGLPFHRLVWLMPAAYLAHVSEEAPNFVAWIQRQGGTITQREFLVLNALSFPLFLAVCANAGLRRTPAAFFIWSVVASTVMLWNALFHIGLTVAFDRYSPGLVTAALIHWPLSLFLGREALRQGVIGPRRLTLALIVGLAIMSAVAGVALHGFRI